MNRGNSRRRSWLAALKTPPELFDARRNGLVSPWLELIVWLVVCGVPFVPGLADGWPVGRIVAYAALSVLFFGLTQLRRLVPLDARPHWAAAWGVLLLIGVVGLGLQSLSADPFVQPSVYAVPLAYAAVVFAASQVAALAALYLGLLALAMWLNGLRDPATIWLMVASYGTLLLFIFVITRLAVTEGVARQRVAVLAEELARERDYLQRLIAVTGSLAQDLDLHAVLNQVAVAGRTLTDARQVFVWLPDGPAAPPGRPERGRPHKGAAMWLGAAAPLAVASEAAPSPIAGETDAFIRDDALVVPLVFNRAAIGVLELRGAPSGAWDIATGRLLRPFADAAAIALEQAYLFEQARQSAMLGERNRLAHELHDTLAQKLTALRMHATAAQQQLPPQAATAEGQLAQVNLLARNVLDDIRRSVWTLASPLLDGASLPEALEAETRRFGARSQTRARYRQGGSAPLLDHDAATQALRIVLEALQNIERHAAASRVTVELQHDADAVRIAVTDDGRGFEPATLTIGGRDGGGFGLLSMRERAGMVGGVLEVESAPGLGTRVRLTIPQRA